MSDKGTIIDYAPLATSGGFSHVYVPADGVPVDGSDKLSRQLSPFTIRCIPPPVLQHLLQPMDDGTWRMKQPAARKRVARAAAATRKQNKQQHAAREAQKERGTAKGAVQPFLAKAPTEVQTFMVNGKEQVSSDSIYRTPALADDLFLADVITQLAALAHTPPLTLLINPNSLSVSYTKVQAFDEVSRKGYIFHSWGEEQPTINITGKTGAFYAGALPTGNLAAQRMPTGVQWASRHASASWQQLMSLFHLYKSSGHIYNTLSGQQGVHYTGLLAIEYDQWAYYGHMEGFDFGYDDAHQHGGIEFSFDFTVNRMFDRSKRHPQVLPMRSPIPSPSDFNSAAGVSVGSLDIPGNAFSAQQRVHSRTGGVNQAPAATPAPTSVLGASRGTLGFRK